MDKPKKRILGIGVIAVIVFVFAFAASGSGVIEQNAEGDGGVTVAASAVTSSINYQGRLTDSSTGEPLSETYTMTFRLYDVASGGAALDTDTNTVEVTDGLFNTEIDFNQSYFDGRELWLGITVGGDEEMTQRQELRPVPYALSLVPGAVINGSVSGGPVLKVENTCDYTGDGVRAYSDNGDGVYGYSNRFTGGEFPTGGVGVYGEVRGDTVDGAGVKGVGPFGVKGEGIFRGVHGTSSATGVYGYSSGSYANSYGVKGRSLNSIGVKGEGKYGGFFTTNQGGTPADHNTGVNVTTTHDYSDGVRVSTTGDNSEGVYASTTGDNSEGVYAQTSGINSPGVHVSTSGMGSPGVQVSTSGNYGTGVRAFSAKSHGVYARTRSADHAGVFATGNDSGADLILGGTGDKGVEDDGRIYSDPYYPSSDIYLITNDDLVIVLDKNGDDKDADFKIIGKNNKLIFNVDESGDMYASGTKNAVVATEDYGTRKMYALESTEVWFEDFGMTQLQDGVAVVEIDPVFAETVNLSVAYHVFFTPVDGWAPIYVANKTSTSFEVRDAHDEADITLEYRIVARRLGYEDVRMEQVEFGNEEA